VRCIKEYLLLVKKILEVEKGGNHRTKYTNIILDVTNLIEKYSQTYGIIIAALHVYCFGVLTFELFQMIPFYAYFASGDLNFIILTISKIVVLISWISIFNCLMGAICFQCTKVEEIYCDVMKTVQNSKFTRTIENKIAFLELEEDLKFHAEGLYVVDRSMIFKVCLMKKKFIIA